MTVPKSFAGQPLGATEGGSVRACRVGAPVDRAQGIDILPIYEPSTSRGSTRWTPGQG